MKWRACGIHRVISLLITHHSVLITSFLSLVTRHLSRLGGIMSRGEALERPRAYLDVRMGELLARLAKDYPQQEALVYPDRRLRYDFSQLEWMARQIARGLLSLGVERGERVALWATNIPEWVVLQFALAKIGAVLVTVNTSLRAAELEYLLKQSEASTLITVSGFRDIDYVATI